MNANDIIDEAFDEFANQFDHESNEWLDMDVQMIFAAGWKAALKSSLPAESEVELAAQDASLGGTAFMQDGKRIDPAEVYSLPAETVSEAMVERALRAYYPQAAGKKLSEDAYRKMRAALEAAVLAHTDGGWRPIDIVFDGPPGPEAGRFVEVESPPGISIKLGEWIQDGKYWRLRFKARPLPAPPKDGRE